MNICICASGTVHLFSAGEKYGSGSELQKSICKGTEWKYQLF